jgi:hypothetical protein
LVFLLHVDKAFCLSAAKKKEYEAFSLFRQLLFLQLSSFPATLFYCALQRRSLGRRTIARRGLAGKEYIDAAEDIPVLS